MASRKIPPKKEPLVIRAHSLTHEADHLLHQLSQEASDVLGWTVSNSAVIRGLLRYVKQQPPAWVATALLPFIEQEIAQGRVWGSKKK
jgi:hypothetical protein